MWVTLNSLEIMYVQQWAYGRSGIFIYLRSGIFSVGVEIGSSSISFGRK